MTTRCILLALANAPSDEAALATALTVAKQLNAHLDAVLLVAAADNARPLLIEPLPARLSDEILTLLVEAREKAASAALARFEAACTAAGVSLVERPPGPPGATASARWLATWAADEIARRACVADLVVLPRPTERTEPLVAAVRETLLLSARRPLLLAPHVALPPPEGIGRRVAVAWNGRPEAARAVDAALPFLAMAQAVRVLTARTVRTGSSEAERLVEYLLWHGIAAEPAPIEPMAREPVGAALLRTAAAFETDLLVMGGYGHSRFREMLLGGVTHYVAGNAELPVLMAH
jgi:nucleotide-binding universal stress UspA family protein